MKKIIAIVLAMVLVLSLSVTAFAADLNGGSGDVTVKYTKGEDGGTIYRVDVTWGSMAFDYTSEAKGTWNPETHNYDNAAEAKWECAEGANKITVTNHSNTEVKVSLSYNQAEGYTTVNGAFDQASLTLPTAEGTTFANAPAASALLTLSGKLAESSEAVKVGTVTVTLNK